MSVKEWQPRLEVLDNCPVCHSKDIAKWSYARDLWTQLSKQKFTYSKCHNCNVLFISHRPLEEDINYFYRDDYKPYQTSVSTLVNKKPIFAKIIELSKEFFKFFSPNYKLLQKIKSVYTSSLNYESFLDFGCGAGDHLNLLKDLNWKTVGVDFSPISVNQVRSNGHDGHMVNDFFEDSNISNFDLVRMSHVVEHLYHPEDVMNIIAGRMKHKSILHIAVPNPQGFSSILFKRNWYGLECPRHIILFSPDVLVKLLERVGFGSFDIYHESITKDFVRSLGYWLAELGLIKLERVNNLIHSKLLSLILFLPLAFVSKIGYGDRYHIFCKRL